MKEFLYWIIYQISKVHNFIISLNDNYETYFTDKQLHFLVIGILGMAMILVIYPLFKWLAKKNKTLVIAWIYVFTVILVITFAIEIGQKVTGTGAMEFADIVYGVFGFIVMFAIFAIIRWIYLGIKYLIKKKYGKQDEINVLMENEDFKLIKKNSETSENE